MNVTGSGEIDLSDLRFVAPEKPIRVTTGDVLFNNTNSPSLVGKTALIVTDDEWAFSNHMTRIRSASLVDSEFVAKQLHFLRESGYFLQHCAKHVNQASISSKFLSSELPFLLPPAGEQKRIVARVKELQARSRATRESLELLLAMLEQFRQSVLAAAFRGDLTADWRAQNPDVEPASELLDRIRAERREHWERAEWAAMRVAGRVPADDRWKSRYVAPEAPDPSRLPELPHGWGWATLEEVSSGVDTICYGVVQPGDQAEGGVPLLRVCDIEGGRVDAEELRTISADVDAQYSRSRLQGGEVVVTVVGTIGRVAIAPLELRGANIARAVARIVPLSGVRAEWISAALQSPPLQQWLTQEAREVARKTLNIGTLLRTTIPVAPVEEMAVIERIIPKVLDAARRVEIQVRDARRQLVNQDRAILSKAFRGELVPQDPSDEPASVLLERIRAEREAAGGAQRRGRKRAAR
jgi:type I restriction enzyme S subunit